MCCRIHVQSLVLKLDIGTCICELKMSVLIYRIWCLGGVSEAERQWTAGQAHTRWHHQICPAPRHLRTTVKWMHQHHQEHNREALNKDTLSVNFILCIIQFMSVRIGCIGLLVQQKSKKKSKLHWKQFLIILSNYIYMHLIFKKFLLLHFHCLMIFFLRNVTRF